MNANRAIAGAGALATLALLWLVGLYLRLPILVAPPLAPMIGAELGLNQSEVGALTTIPVLMLALGALPGAFAIARLGPVLTVAGSLVVLALASAARGLAPPTELLLATTALMGFAIAVMQPALPVLVMRWCPTMLALGSAVYMNGLLAGEFIGAGLTLPLVVPWLDGSWRAALVFWSLPALAVALLVCVRGPVSLANSGNDVVNGSWAPRWREGRVWKFGVILGAASSGFFGTNAYLGSILAERGEAHLLDTTLLLFNAAQVVGSLLMVAIGRWLVGKPAPVLGMAALLPLGLLVGALSGGVVFVTAIVLVGLTTCVQLILMVSLVPQITSEEEAGPLAAGMFAVGYLLGFVVPLAGGVAADLTGYAGAAWWPLIALAAVAAVVALSPGFGHRALSAEHHSGGS